MEKMSSRISLAALNAGNSCRQFAGDFKECITCSLCFGFLRSAVTVTLCMHSFCRECLRRHFRRSKACPKCLCLIHPVKPSTNIRSDFLLQRLVYKMLPGLFEIEHERWKKQVLVASEKNKGSAQRNRKKREFDKASAIFTGNENVSICLQHRPSSNIQDGRETHPDLGPRYLLCPSAVRIEILKKFIENKFSLSQKMEVNIFYLDHLLADDYKLIDVAYIYGWDQVNPMMLSYSILQLNLNAPASQYTCPVTTHHDAEKSTARTKPFRESSTSTTVSQSSQKSISAAETAAALSSSLGNKAKLATISSSNADVSTVGENDDCSTDGVKVSQCHSTSESTVRKRGHKRKKSQRCSGSPSPAKKQFHIRDDGPVIRKTFLPVRDRDGVKSPAVPSPLSMQNLQSSRASPIDASISLVTESTKENMVQSDNPLYSNASTMVISADQVSVSLNTCGSMNTDLSQSHVTSKDTVLDHLNCVAFRGANDTVASDGVNTNILGSADRVELALGLDNRTDPEGNVVGDKSASSTENAVISELSNVNKLATNRAKELISGFSSISHISDSFSNLDRIDAVSSTFETKVVGDTTTDCDSEISLALNTNPAELERGKTQFLEADSSMLPASLCTSGIYGQSSCSQMASESCETVQGDGFRDGQKDAVLCPQCGRKTGFVDGTNVTSTSNTIKCHNCLSFNTSITVFISHGQGRINPDERIEFSRSQVPYEEPKERTRIPEVPKVQINDPSGDEDFRADLTPKVECLDGDELSPGLNCGLHNHWDRTCSQLKHPPFSSAVSTISGNHCQPPANPDDLSFIQTKAMCQSSHQSTVASNGSASRVFCPSPSDSSPAVAGSAAAVAARAGSSTDRCPAVVTGPLTGIKCGRKQKSLESIIRQLQPRQMSPGDVSLKLSPKAPPSPPPNRKSVVQETPVKTPPAHKEPSTVEDRLTLRAAEGEGHGQSWSTENQSLLKRTLASSSRNYQVAAGRFPKPEVRLNAAPSSDQSPYSFAAPPIKKLKNMFDGLESAGYPYRLNGPLSRGENRRLSQPIQTALTPATGIRTVRLNSQPSHPETVFQDNHAYGMSRRYPTVAVTSANGFDAPLELTTKESRDRKRRETAKKSDGDVLRTSFPLIDNRR